MQNAATSDVVLSAKNVEILPGRYYTPAGFANPPQGNAKVPGMEVLD